MTIEEINHIISKGEGINTEFKSAEFELSKNTFETICAFLNRSGGTLIFGVADNGSINGIIDWAVQSILDTLVTGFNDPQQLNPTFYLAPQHIAVDGKNIVYLKIPESSQVHKTGGRIFDRNEDGDFDITGNHELVKNLYQRKSNIFTENTIYPYLQITDLRDDLINKVRIMAGNSRPNHPWQSMNNEELLKSARLYQTNFKTNESGYTLAAALIFGKDEVIQSILPAYKTDALVRIKDTDRYDDRDEVRTNLIESYDRLMQFIRKHLPDPFYLEGDQRISLRDIIFREAIINTLIHREFTNAYPARLIIDNEKVTIDNWNLPVKHGLIAPKHFYTHPKNPNILQVFKEIRYADELGSGVRNIFKYSKTYSGGMQSEIREMDVFKIIIPYKKQTRTATFIEKPDMDFDERIKNILTDNLVDISDDRIKRLVRIVRWILQNPRTKLIDLQKEFNISKRTSINDLQELKAVIEYVGSKKTGGFFIKDEIVKQIEIKTK